MHFKDHQLGGFFFLDYLCKAMSEVDEDIKKNFYSIYPKNPSLPKKIHTHFIWVFPRKIIGDPTPPQKLTKLLRDHLK